MGARQSRAEWCDPLTKQDLLQYGENGGWLEDRHAKCISANKCNRFDPRDQGGVEDACFTKAIPFGFQCSNRCPRGYSFHRWHRHGLGQVCSCVRAASEEEKGRGGEEDVLSRALDEKNIPYVVGAAIVLALLMLLGGRSRAPAQQ